MENQFRRLRYKPSPLVAIKAIVTKLARLIYRTCFQIAVAGLTSRSLPSLKQELLDDA
jgi:hypothetical protein